MIYEFAMVTPAGAEALSAYAKYRPDGIQVPWVEGFAAIRRILRLTHSLGSSL
jgi:hypothetical protein